MCKSQMEDARLKRAFSFIRTLYVHLSTFLYFTRFYKDTNIIYYGIRPSVALHVHVS